MTKYTNPNQTNGIDWEAIFLRRPDLAPPGYHETCKIIKERHAKKQSED